MMGTGGAQRAACWSWDGGFPKYRKWRSLGTRSYRVLVLGALSLLANERYVFQTIPQQFTLQDTEAGGQMRDTADRSRQQEGSPH